MPVRGSVGEARMLFFPLFLAPLLKTAAGAAAGQGASGGIGALFGLGQKNRNKVADTQIVNALNTWLTEIEQRVDAGERSPAQLQTWLNQLDAREAEALASLKRGPSAQNPTFTEWAPRLRQKIKAALGQGVSQVKKQEQTKKIALAGGVAVGAGLLGYGLFKLVR